MTHSRRWRVLPALVAAALCAALTVTAVATASTGHAHSKAAAHRAPRSQAGLAATQSYNGLALTPPMGWDDWFQYRCTIDQSIVLANAQALVSSGLAKDGYKYVNLDDCWMATTRTADGQLQANPTRFPQGIRWLADKVHAMGLKLGIYESAGTTTCSGYPGSLGHYQQDADTFASWGVNYVKFDYCGSLDGTNVTDDYAQMSKDLLATGKPMVYNEELTIAAGNADSANPDYLPMVSASSTFANEWRVAPDDYPNFDGTVLGHMLEDLPLASYAHPGAWNNPEMLATGGSEFQWTEAEEETQMSIWAELAAPLVDSSDLASMTAATEHVLSNRAVIAVDQDRLGQQGHLVTQDGPVYIVAKPLAGGDVAVLFANTSPITQHVSTTAQAAGLRAGGAYTTRNLWTGTTRETAGTITASVPPSGTVLYRVSPQRSRALTGAPATRVQVSAPAAQAGQSVTVPATLTNNDAQALRRVALSLAVPAGWKVTGHPATARTIPAGRQLTGRWQVSVPAGTTASDYTLTATARYTWGPGQVGSQSGQGNLKVGDALAGYVTSEFGVSQKYPPYAAQVTPVYRDITAAGKPTLLAGTAITTGTDPLRIAITPDGKYAYVTDHGSNNVDVIDTATNTMVKTIPVGAAPSDIAITPSGQDAYVADTGSNNVDVIDTATNTVTQTIAAGTQPYGVAITPSGATAYVSDEGSATVTPINTATGSPGPAIPVGTDPHQIAIASNGQTAYVANMGSASVTPITTATGTPGPAIGVPCAGPDAATIDPATSTLYVACFGASGINPATYGAVVPISTTTNTVGSPITVSAHPQGLAVTPSGAAVYATDAFQSTLTPINAISNTAETPIHLPGAHGIAIQPTP